MPDQLHRVTRDGETNPSVTAPDETGDIQSDVLSTLPPADPLLLQRLRDAAEAGDVADLTNIVRNNWWDLLIHRNRALLDATRSLRSEQLRDTPLLAMFAGILYYRIPSRRLKGLRFFVGATRAATSDKRALRAVDRALILTSASASYRLIGHPGLGIKPARTVLRILNDMPDVERDSMHALPRLYAQVGATLYASGQTEDALSAFEHGLAEVPQEGYPHGFMNLAMLAGIHALRGDIAQSMGYVDIARSPKWPEATLSMYPGTYYRIAEATVSLENFDVPNAQRHLEALVHDRATIEHWIPIALTEALVGLVDRHPGAALAGLDTFAAARQGEGRSASARNQLAPVRSLLQLALGNPEAAVSVLSRDAAAGPEKEIARARAELVLGRHGAALQCLRRVAGTRLSTRLGAEAAVLEVACLLRGPGRSPRRDALENLGARLRTSGLRIPLTLLPDEDFLRVHSALGDVGYADVLTRLPTKALIQDLDSELSLTKREHAVLESLANTSSNAAIAKELVVSVNTVKTQLRSIYRKLGVTTRDEAIAVALARHLVIMRPLPSDQVRDR